MIKSDLKQLVVLNEIRSKLEMLHSDIIPESEKHVVIDATKNVAANVHSTNGSYNNAYTTRTLVPSGNSVLDFAQSFLSDNFNFNFAIYLNSKTYADTYMLFGPVTTAAIYDKLYLLIDNTEVWSTTFNKTEARIASLSLPSSDVNYSHEYAGIDKLLDGKHSPMKILKIPAYSGFTYTRGGAYVTENYYKCYIYKLRFDLTCDLNRLCVPFSNIDYICYNYGGLSVKTDFYNIHQAMHYFVLPTTTSINYSANAADGTLALQNGNSILTLNPVQWLMNSPVVNTNNGWYLNMQGLEQWIPTPIPIDLTLTDGSPNTWATSCPIKKNTALKDINATVAIDDNGTVDLTNAKFASIPIAFCLNPSTTDGRDYLYMFELLDSQIMQTTFDIDDGSKEALDAYFSSLGHIIIPIQVFATSDVNNGTLGPTSGSYKYPANNIIGDLAGNNFSDLIITCSPLDSPSSFVNTYAQDYTIYIKGLQINQNPYAKVNNRAIKDYTDACVDTDCEEINTDFLYSLQFPPEIVSGDSANTTFTGLSAPNQYFADGDFNRMKTLNWDSSSTRYFKNPNGFMHVAQLQIPEAYHTGYAIVENSPQTVSFKLTGTYNTTYNQMVDTTQCRFVNKHKQFDEANNKVNLYSDTNLTIPSYVNRDCVLRVTGLCDALLVLNYDSGIRTCTGGYISWSSPYISESLAAAA